MATNLADEYANIRQRMEAIDADRKLAMTGEAALVEPAPYSPSALNEAARQYMTGCTFNLPDMRGRVKARPC